MRLEEIKKELPETPDFIHRMMVEEVENQLGKKDTAVSIRTLRKKRKWSPARAAAVAALGLVYYQEGRYETAREHMPDYLRVSQAERERAEREKARQQAESGEAVQ